ncbi:hybrid sensor histidine kinase/response regulator [Puniceibacterium sediminis]|uniref:histidine kinase n=1 Tax=Puniceibacterium sediminis TaxID=1608407 RepID=A0A238UUQ8_9RHOB|nr:PAS domain-containing hybrid sensor histidine kinase/response regulator [Puniceibacterium sediminis]SNR25778.1 Signal transduction histidine kinase [Puniceibacterium sediminis]
MLTKLLWALPAAVAILLVETSMGTGISVPVPFLTIIVCVTIAGAFGGQRAGLLAGSMGALFVVRAYFEQFGPPSLTGGVPQAAIGSALIFSIGTLLGRLKDQRDTSVKSLRENEKILESLLDREKVEKGRQATKVAESEARLSTAVRIAGVGHYSFSVKTGNCDFCSDQHAAHFGLTPDEYCARAAGPNPELFYVHSDDHHIVLDAIGRINSGEALIFEYRAVRPNGEIRYIREFEEPIFDHNGDVVENVGTSIDLTELRQAEIRLRQSQRIEALGTLTGGVAHDFNNLLAIILGNLELSLENGQADDWRDLIGEAIKATKRGADLTKNLLSFSRRAHLEPRRLNLNQSIQKTMAWASRVLPETIDVENALMAGIWDVELDAASVENAIINILLNARDAMPAGGKVTIETANMRIGEEYFNQRDEDIAPGRYVMLAISDTGHGIPPEKIDAIFEPFYTDKPVGQGSGLGLSMVHGFIKQSGGAIRVHSEVGVGTTFKLYFKAAMQPETPPQSEITEPLHPVGKRAEILVVEDEKDVIRILKRVLEGAGYAVTTATSGDEGLQKFKSSGRFDLLLSDVVMPGKLQGPALAKAIRSIDPDIPCIFLSGYASEATIHGNGLKPSDIRLMKPVSRLDLLRAVSKALIQVKEKT